MILFLHSIITEWFMDWDLFTRMICAQSYFLWKHVWHAQIIKMTVQSLPTVLLIVSTFCSGKWSSWSCLAPPSYKPLLSHAEPETKSECQNLPCKTTNHKPQYCSPSLAPSADLPNNYPRLLSASTSVSPSHAATAAYAPKNKVDLKVAVDACIGLSPSGHCPAAWGPIGSWDVSAVTDMSQLFSNARRSVKVGRVIRN